MNKYIKITKVHPEDKDSAIYLSVLKAFKDFPTFQVGEYLEEEIMEDRINRIICQLRKDSLIKRSI